MRGQAPRGREASPAGTDTHSLDAAGRRQLRLGTRRASRPQNLAGPGAFGGLAAARHQDRRRARISSTRGRPRPPPRHPPYKSAERACRAQAGPAASGRRQLWIARCGRAPVSSASAAGFLAPAPARDPRRFRGPARRPPHRPRSPPPPPRPRRAAKHAAPARRPGPVEPQPERLRPPEPVQAAAAASPRSRGCSARFPRFA